MSRVLTGSLLLAGLAAACLVVPHSLGRTGDQADPGAHGSLISGTNEPMVLDTSVSKAEIAGYRDGRPVPAGFEMPHQTRWVMRAQQG